MTYLEKPPIHEVADELLHYGMPRRSGRYPWGSGEDPYQHNWDLINRVDELKKQGKTESQIAEELGILNEKGKPSSSKLRAQLSIANEERRKLEVAKIKSLKADGHSGREIEKMTGIPESTQRSLLKSEEKARIDKGKGTADILKKHVDEKGMIDVGAGVERELNVSKEMLNQALERLKLEGYEVYGGRMPQPTNPGQHTTLKVLCPPGTPHKDIYNYGEIHSIKDYITRDGGETFEKKFHYPASLDSSRLKILLTDEPNPIDGEPGNAKDGVIQLRRGVPDLSLGESRYSQVRILVDGDKYLKGMAVYADNMPDGIDVIFNSNKTSYDKALKKIKNDPDNPFGSAIKDAEQGGQYWYTDEKTGEKKLGLINKRADEGDWSDWKDKLPSQFLSKQNLSLAKKQLKMAIDDKEMEFNEICALENPTVKKRLLDTFANDCDSAAVHLSAAALPRQKYHVIIPVNTLKEGEIYAPRYKDGEKVALIRYPHGGTFEIPILTVNNKHMPARNLLGATVGDAVGINKKVAERLSGADFDGDTVMVIPTHNGKVKITSTSQLKGLEGFDPQVAYCTTEKDGNYYNASGHKIKVMSNTQTEMGIISNLITDMTLQNATEDELARAVRHSMVVIDAEKHKLDYRTSYEENGIDALKKKYQTGGASTLISRAKSQESVLKRRGTPDINIKGSDKYDPTRPEGALLYKTAYDSTLFKPVESVNKNTGVRTLTTLDGQKIKYDPKDQDSVDKYKPYKYTDPDTGEVTYKNKTGNISYLMEERTQKSTKMAETDDAYSLISDADTPMEREYANYANKMKSLANEARKTMVTTGKIAYSPEAKKQYAAEVKSLDDKLDAALLNAPRERQALAIANSRIKAKKQDNPDMTKDEEKKIRQQELKKAREKVGAKRTLIEITDNEWKAIQAGAISENKLSDILNNTDIDDIREKATPRANKAISDAKISKIKQMKANGYTLEEIARHVGVSTSTVTKY